MLVLSKYKSYPTDQTEFIIAGMMLQYSKVTVKVKMFEIRNYEKFQVKKAKTERYMNSAVMNMKRLSLGHSVTRSLGH